MAASGFGPSYLSQVEASHLASQAIPGAVVVHLRREISGELAAGRKAQRMFIELTLSEAIRHWQNMGDLIREAGALSRQPGHADAAGNY